MSKLPLRGEPKAVAARDYGTGLPSSHRPDRHRWRSGGWLGLYFQWQCVALESHAALWRGTAASFEVLHPVGAESSRIFDAAGDWQAGRATFGGKSHAGIWQADAASFVDLHSILTPGVYASTDALRMWTDGRTIKIAGSAVAAATAKSHAILWSITLPDEEAPVIVAASASSRSL